MKETIRIRRLEDGYVVCWHKPREIEVIGRLDTRAAAHRLAYLASQRLGATWEVVT